jgi:hypothetical protein
VGEIGRVNWHIGIRRFTNPEDKKHEHFGTENSEIPTGGKLRFGAQTDVISSKQGIENLHGENPEAALSHPSVGTRGRNRGLRKNPDRRVHRHYGIRKITNAEDETSGAVEVSKSREVIRTVHHRRTRGGDQSIREISRRKKSPIEKSVNRRSGNRGVRRACHQGSRSLDS